VESLSRTEWRVLDATDAGRIVGFIERLSGGRFEIVWMSDPMRWGYAKSFDEAVAAFSDGASFAGEVFLERADVAGSPRSAARAERGSGGSRRSTWVDATSISTDD
jgi:hypothetical protein